MDDYDVPPERDIRIIFVEDDHLQRRLTHLSLQGYGYSVKSYSSSVNLLADEESLVAACLLSDYRLDELDGVALLLALRERGWTKPAILYTGYWSQKLVDQAKIAGYREVLAKPVSPRLLTGIIAQLVPPQAIAEPRLGKASNYRPTPI